MKGLGVVGGDSEGDGVGAAAGGAGSRAGRAGRICVEERCCEYSAGFVFGFFDATFLSVYSWFVGWSVRPSFGLFVRPSVTSL